jgi:hypothetical protein
MDHTYFFCGRWIEVYVDGTERYSDTGDLVEPCIPTSTESGNVG